MFHFFLLLALVIIICLLPIKKQRTCLIMCLVPIFLFIVLQNNWTPDYQSYKDSYREAHYNWLFSYFSENHEFGWAFLCAVMPSYRMLIAFQAALICIALYIIFYYYIPRKNWILCFLLYWVNSNMMLMTMSAMRSSVVMSLFVIAIHFRLNGYKHIPFMITVPLFLIHKSAIILLPFVLMGKKMSKKVVTLIYVLIILVLIVNFISPNLFVNYVSGFFSEREELHSYLYYTTLATKGSGNVLMILLINCCLFYLMYMELKLKATQNNHVDFYFICAIFLFLLQGSGIPMVTRFESYFGPFALVCYTRMLQYDKGILPRSFMMYLLLTNLYYMIVFVPKMGQWETLREYHSILF